MEEFKRSKEAEARAEEAESGPAFYALDKHGAPHFAMSKEEAVGKAQTANEGYQ